MNHYQLTELVRERVRALFAEMGPPEAPSDVNDAPEGIIPNARFGDESVIKESVLIRDGHYCGRRFECDGNSAVWFIEENQIKCFTQEGALHSVVDAIHDVAPRRAA